MRFFLGFAEVHGVLLAFVEQKIVVFLVLFERFVFEVLVSNVVLDVVEAMAVIGFLVGEHRFQDVEDLENSTSGAFGQGRTGMPVPGAAIRLGPYGTGLWPPSRPPGACSMRASGCCNRLNRTACLPRARPAPGARL